MAWITPIVDRTAQDVIEHTEKGYCNVGDINRLEENCAVLGELLGVEISTQTWSRTDKPPEAAFRRINDNIAALREAFYTYAVTPATPEYPLNSWDKWNSAEKILADMYELYHKTAAATPGLGECYAGEQIGVI
ncbi:hypothetical protein H8711_04130 [Clostridiaceae bacterium NSJ-31]|uniref:Uncharacterized protein n=1 Tax=Ligaoa zhengdingensis TaxID=2763658 RepID=A0A926HZN6_9FIRM|nr:hypothetical protein [Ligaoa zhengdingensis]MBC8546122.1 hypothetical protein [Ligaoa zhengdingensis]